MSAIYETLRQEPYTAIKLIEGPDDVCAAFPSDQPSHCENASVYRKDREILQQVGLKPGLQLSWQAICDQVARQVKPHDIATLCSDCIWQPFGLCEEGVAHIRESGSLRELPEAR
ncbi:DUF1284 domain-containing protein [Paenibacillus protaetiae]|uniref:DUF1284 domain-containing protein n=2 Tax=Paenibacillus protaetiae TaxID=2509456 RepID=A0A4P6EZY5_9BACL|nr:DUF1284 domain-containing protein [Paenibacillus protaetiae]